MSDKNHLNTKWAALIERCEMGNENGAEEVLKQLRIRDELLAALKDMCAAPMRPEKLARARAAIVKAEPPMPTKTTRGSFAEYPADKFSEYKLHCLVADASDLGLPAGKWPAAFKVLNKDGSPFGNGQPFMFFYIAAKGDEHKIVYRQHLGCASITILND